MFMINGCGSTLYGKTVVAGQEGYIATKWFCLLWTPIIPLRSYIVLDESGTDLFIWSNKSYRLIPIGSLYKPHLKAYYATIVVIAFFIYVAIWSGQQDKLDSELVRVNDIVNRYNDEGIKLMGEGKIKDAIDSFTEALHRDSSTDVIWSNRADAYYELGDFRKAINDYSKAIDLNPKNPQGYYDRGDSYLALEILDSAITDYQSSIARNEPSGYAHYSLGLIYYNVDDYLRSVESLNESFKLKYDPSKVCWIRGLAFLALGENDKALEDADEILSKNSQSPAGHLLRGLIYDSDGFYGAAEEYFNEYLNYADSS